MHSFSILYGLQYHKEQTGHGDSIGKVLMGFNSLSCKLPLGFFFSLRIFFFKMWTIFKVFIEFITVLILFYVSVFWPQGMWELSSGSGRDQTWTPALEGKVLTTGSPGKFLSIRFLEMMFIISLIVTNIVAGRGIPSRAQNWALV